MGLKTLKKQPRDSRLYDFDFSGALRTGDTITSVVVVEADASGLTIGTPTHDSNATVQVRVSDGTDGTKYKLSCVVTTSLGDTIELDGYLKVQDT